MCELTMREFAVTFDGSLEGFLCIVHAYYYEKILPVSISSEHAGGSGSAFQNMLWAEEYYIATDSQKAVKVQKAVRDKISSQAEHYLNYAFLADKIEYMNLFRYLILGFKLGESVDCHLQTDYVLAIHKNARYVGREAHLLTGFCRFAEVKMGEGKLYYCNISPVNNVLEILAEHFSDRMMNQAWVIYDKKRKIAAVYNGNHYVIGSAPNINDLEYSDSESQIQELWKTFFHSLAIKQRTNKKLQRNHVPLHFRRSMLEFKSGYSK